MSYPSTHVAADSTSNSRKSNEISQRTRCRLCWTSVLERKDFLFQKTLAENDLGLRGSNILNQTRIFPQRRGSPPPASALPSELTPDSSSFSETSVMLDPGGLWLETPHEGFPPAQRLRRSTGTVSYTSNQQRQSLSPVHLAQQLLPADHAFSCQRFFLLDILPCFPVRSLSSRSALRSSEDGVHARRQPNDLGCAGASSLKPNAAHQLSPTNGSGSGRAVVPKLSSSCSASVGVSRALPRYVRPGLPV